MDDRLSWKGTVTIRGRSRYVELRFYPEKGCWQLFEQRGNAWIRMGVRGLVTEVLSVVAADLLCKNMGRSSVKPEPFERSFSIRYRTLLARAGKYLKKSDGEILSKEDRKRYRHVLDELQGYEAREDKWRGKGPILSEISARQLGILRALETMTARLEQRMAELEKGKAP